MFSTIYSFQICVTEVLQLSVIPSFNIKLETQRKSYSEFENQAKRVVEYQYPCQQETWLKHTLFSPAPTTVQKELVMPLKAIDVCCDHFCEA